MSIQSKILLYSLILKNEIAIVKLHCYKLRRKRYKDNFGFWLQWQ